ncbi:MAG: COQ9 family protein [Acidisphaera sp.]|nr:COQ9 family protein [Acidisphaera sp.]
MIEPPERSEERDAALTALLARVPAQGWTFSALRAALRDIGAEPEGAELLFPGGAADMIEAFCDLADRRMAAEAAGLDLGARRLPARVRALIALRLAQHRAHREAVRRALGILALPRHAGLAATCTARTVDAIWHAAGDRSADFSWYTKRATLAGIYTATVLFWLRDAAEDDTRTLGFLDRRLADIGRIGALRRRLRPSPQAGDAKP